jgi:hypothetical protein
MENKPNNFVHTNIRVFYHIAQEAFLSMDQDLNSSRRPKPNGESGWIITYDPDQKSFKNAFITIVFCGVFLESLLHLLIVERKGLDIFKKYDRKPYTLKDKLQLLGCNDQSILDDSTKCRDTRNKVVHEKAYVDINSSRVAQKEATFAMGFVNKIVAHFNFKID